MTYFIVLHGTSGTGKTTIAKQLAKVLNAKHIALDIILKENKLDNHEPGSCLITAKDFMKGIDIITPIVKNSLQNGEIVILDGCIYHKEVLDYIIKKINYRNHIFTLKTPLSTCLERDRKRKKPLNDEVVKGVYELVHQNNFGILIENKNKTVQETINEILLNLEKE